MMTEPSSVEILAALLQNAKDFCSNAMAGNLQSGTCHFPEAHLRLLSAEDEKTFYAAYPNLKLIPIKPYPGEDEFLTVSKLKAAIADLPDDTLVCYNDLEGAFWGDIAFSAEIVKCKDGYHRHIPEGTDVLFIR